MRLVLLPLILVAMAAPGPSQQQLVAITGSRRFMGSAWSLLPKGICGNSRSKGEPPAG